MPDKERFEIEFILNTSISILYKEISTPSGLSEWFSDDVDVDGDHFTFHWEGGTEVAAITDKKKDEFIRFKWEEDEDDASYFEFRIRTDPITQEVALIITDFAETGEVEEAKLLWESQVDVLKQVIGA